MILELIGIAVVFAFGAWLIRRRIDDFRRGGEE